MSVAQDLGNLLLVDYANIFSKGWHVHRNLTYRGVNTGGLFGFVSQVCNAVVKNEIDTVLVCHDAKPYVRLKECPTYKQNRTYPDDPELVKMLTHNHRMCHEFIIEAGIPQWRTPGYEADDLIAAGISLHKNSSTKIVVMSSDTDLYQLFNCPTPVFFWKNNKAYSVKDFKKEYGVSSVKDWKLIMAMTGGHNNLEKVPSVGIKTAVKIISDPEKLDEVTCRYKNVIETNLSLGKLPYDSGWKKYPVPRLGINTISLRKAILSLSKSGIQLSPVMENALLRLAERPSYKATRKRLQR